MRARLARGTTTALASTTMPPGGAGPDSAHGGYGATADGVAAGPPGTPSGNPAPADAPVNACGSTVNATAPPTPRSATPA
ncbi:chaplin family protein [Streptomyces sp. M-16]|uniref:chaplin family protein n=1 Tax=Streptomyces sp. M-16 TaxID=3233040 RepID=UPI00225B2BF4